MMKLYVVATFVILFPEVLVANDIDKSPNLLIVMTDEHNIRTLGCYRDLMDESQAFVWGNGVKVDTPNIDRLASQGALLTNYNVASPTCTPSRASFFSGLYPNATGAWGNHEPYHDDIVTFGEILAEKRGYRTSYMGKWHLNGEPKPGFNHTNDFGFRYNRYMYNRGHWKFMDKVNGEMEVYDYKDIDKFQGRIKEHFTTDYLFDRGIEFIDKANDDDKPWALVLSIPDPHGPNDVRAPYDTMFDDLKFSVPRTAVKAFKRNPSRPLYVDYPPFDFNITEASDIIEQMTNDESRQKRLQLYFGMVACIDENMGKLFSFLDNNTKNDDTIVIFTSDHGDLLDEHAKNNKGNPYQTSASAPFIIRYPGHIEAGKVIKSAYSSIDVFPTLMTLMNARNDETEEVLSHLPGLDASEEFLNNIPVNNQTRYMTDGKSSKWAAAYTYRYKLVLSADTPWLFDMEKDPDEVINYYSESGYDDISTELKNGLVDTMFEHNFTLLDSDKAIYLDKPACVDSRDRLRKDITRTCNDISTSDCVERDIISEQCPVTCGYSSCCKDSKGPFLVGGEEFTCKSIPPGYCGKYLLSEYCPVSCGSCIPPTSFPSETPSDAPSDVSLTSLGSINCNIPEADDDEFLYIVKIIDGLETPVAQTCQWLRNKGASKIEKTCALTDYYDDLKPANVICTMTCGVCEAPSISPTFTPSETPTKAPSDIPSFEPTISDFPTKAPSNIPSHLPTTSSLPTTMPSGVPTMEPMSCEDPEAKDDLFLFVVKKVDGVETPIVHTCEWLKYRGESKIEKTCALTDHYDDFKPANRVCRITCGICETPSIQPSIAPSDIPSSIPSLYQTEIPSIFPTEAAIADHESPTLVPTSSMNPSTLPSSIPTNYLTLDPINCDTPEEKDDTYLFKIKTTGNGTEVPVTQTCGALKNKGLDKIERICALTDYHSGFMPAIRVCTNTCGVCQEYTDLPSSIPSEILSNAPSENQITPPTSTSHHNSSFTEEEEMQDKQDTQEDDDNEMISSSEKVLIVSSGHSMKNTCFVLILLDIVIIATLF